MYLICSNIPRQHFCTRDNIVEYHLSYPYHYSYIAESDELLQCVPGLEVVQHYFQSNELVSQLASSAGSFEKSEKALYFVALGDYTVTSIQR